MSVFLSPVGGAGAQFFDNNGNPLTGGKLYTYAAGTTTPQATYTSAAGITFHTNPIILDAAGRVPGSSEIWLADSQIYKFVLKDSNDVLLATWDQITGVNSNFVNYTSETEVQTATAGQTVFTLTTMSYAPGTNSLTVYVDGVNQYEGTSYVETDSTTVTFTAGLHVGALVKFTTAVQTTGNSTDASVVTYDPPFTGSVATTVQDKLAQYVSVKDFGAVGDGVTDDTAAIALGVSYVSGNGGTLYFPRGNYLVNGVAGLDGKKNGINITENYKNIALVGDGALTTITAGANDMYIIRLSSLTTKISNLYLYGNNKTNVTGLGLVPQDTTSTSEVSITNFNTISEIQIEDCAAGIELKIGATAASQCYYNRFEKIRISNCIRGIWFRESPTSSSGTPNRNSFIDVTIYGGNKGNLGIDLGSGDTNEFVNCNLEGILNGTSPFAVPTGIYIRNTDPTTGFSVQCNRFVNCTSEFCTVAIQNNNALSEFYGFTNIDGGLNYDFNVTPNVFIGGYNGGQNPLVTPFLKAPSGADPGGISGTDYATTTLIGTNVTLQANGINAVRVSSAGYTGIGRYPDYHLDVDNSTASDGAVIGVFRTAGGWHQFYGVSQGGANAAASAYSLGKNGTTNRSINAGGTINASGADYAEYEFNAGLNIEKGQIVGFDKNGVLTLSYSDAVRFAIKSTDPSIVGGDSWGVDLEGEALEAARKKVDRVAYAGKVPVNVFGAQAGDYIIAETDENGDIVGKSVTVPNFDQYLKAVGRVQKILDDGRALVAVIVH